LKFEQTQIERLDESKTMIAVSELADCLWICHGFKKAKKLFESIAQLFKD